MTRGEKRRREEDTHYPMGCILPAQKITPSIVQAYTASLLLYDL